MAQHFLLTADARSLSPLAIARFLYPRILIILNYYV